MGKTLSDEFDYRVAKDDKVFVSYLGKQVMTVKGSKAQMLIAELEAADDFGVQDILAKLTGNFKRGNEKQAQWVRKQKNR